MPVSLKNLTLFFGGLLAMTLASCAEESAPRASALADQVAAMLMTAQADQGAYGKYVDDEGNMTLPENFKTDWAHLGSWAVANDGGVEGIHNVYAPKEDVLYFRKHNRFRDGATLVKEVRSARGAAHTTGDAHWAEGVEVWFLMIKDTEGRFPNNPLWGDGWGWALFNGDDPATQVANDYEADCLQCHIPAEKTDWTYIYAYPTLGKEVAQYAPNEEVAASMAVAAMTNMASASADAMAGEQVFQRCAACHSLTPGQHRLGPSLAGVFGREAGTAEGYNYSDALKDAKIVWNEETIASFLSDTKGYIPGTKMGALFPNGVPDEDQRAAVVAYLKEASQ